MTTHMTARLIAAALAGAANGSRAASSGPLSGPRCSRGVANGRSDVCPVGDRSLVGVWVRRPDSTDYTPPCLRSAL